MGVQDKGDVRRFESVGVRPSIIHVTGSIKFDQQMAERKETNAEFAAILDKLKRGKPVVLAASTHDGEEVLIAEAVRKAGGFPLIVPRHAERRHAVVRELEAQGWQCVLRTDGEIPETLKDHVCYIADTTGN
ncbi:MAG: 3-deoxy-D-manno-octulosonic acid transferase [Akkermansia sp.]